jgi:3-mercaptopyruvate sulfurtransferase SseA
VLENLRKPDVVFLDVQSERKYQRRHVPGAVHSLYPEADWQRLEDDGRITLPTAEEFAEMLSELGIASDSHVIIVASGSSDRDMAVATDVYWTFKYFAHDEVSVLDVGGAQRLRRRTVAHRNHRADDAQTKHSSECHQAAIDHGSSSVTQSRCYSVVVDLTSRPSASSGQALRLAQGKRPSAGSR